MHCTIVVTFSDCSFQLFGAYPALSSAVILFHGVFLVFSAQEGELKVT